MNEDMTPDEAMDELVRLSQEMGLYEVSPNEITAIELNFDKTRATHLAILFNGLDTLIDIKTIMKLIQNHFKNPKLVDFPFGPIPNWINVDDQKPKPFTPVLLATKFAIGAGVYRNDGDYFTFRILDGEEPEDKKDLWITHWMPLPLPPKEN